MKLLNDIKYLAIIFILTAGFQYPVTLTSSDTLAAIGDNIITPNQFAKAYREKITRLGLSDNLQTRQQYLFNLINDELLIAEAKNWGINKTEEAARELKRIEIQELLNAYSLVHISPGIKVTEEELQDLFIKMNTRIKVSHLYSTTKEDAELLYNRVLNGESFETLAKEIFRDPALRAGGGSLGYITVDEMDPDFERTAFTLKIGEISKPVKTVKGYSIIKVDDIKANPLITETEFLKARDKLVPFARKRSFEAAAKNHANFLRNKLGTYFNNEMITKLFSAIQNNSSELTLETPYSLTSEDMGKAIVISSLGEWNLAELFEEMKYTSGRQKNFIRTKENLEDFIAGLVNRKYILQKAYDERLNELSSVKENIEFNFNTYLLTAIEEQLKSKIKISPDTVTAYYTNNINKFRTEPEIRLSSILIDRLSLADSVKAMLGDGITFEELAEKYSIQSFTAEKGGDMGFFKKGDLDYLSGEIFNLKTGQWIGPFSDEDKYVFLKCTDFIEGAVKPFNNCAEDIEKNLMAFEWYKFRDEYLGSLKKRIPVQIFFEKLNNPDLFTNN